MPDASGQEQGEGDIIKANASAEQEPCHFLKLPPELREEIYKLCLGCTEYCIGTEDGNLIQRFTGVLINKMDIDRHILPPILQACRSIRAEAASAWFKQNQFFIRVVDLDARLLYKWTQFCRKLVPPPASPVHGSPYYPRMQIYSARGTYVWVNLLQWCQWVYQSQLEVPEETPYFQGEHLATGALKIAHCHRGRPWEECEGSLDGLRTALEGCYKKITII